MSTAGQHHVRVGRAYAPRVRGDGNRVLVDRLWPRGLSKAAADLDDWCRAISPSTELRKWYGHDPDRFDEFSRRYRQEMAEPDRAAALQQLRTLLRRRNLTLLTATKQPEISEATVIADLLRDQRS